MNIVTRIRFISNSFHFSVAMAALVVATLAGQVRAEDAKPNRWQSTIQDFEDQDAKNAPPKNSVLFIGSSSIRKWELKESFPGKDYINRGFGGSQIADSTHFASRIIVPYRPRVIVLYAGDNDIAKGKSPKQVSIDYQEFVQTVHKSLPKSRIVFIAIKPSIARWNLIEKMRETNQLIRQSADKDSRLKFVDIDKPMLGKDGKPRRELFAKDGLHLSAVGYELWTSLVKPHLREQ